MERSKAALAAAAPLTDWTRRRKDFTAVVSMSEVEGGAGGAEPGVSAETWGEGAGGSRSSFPYGELPAWLSAAGDGDATRDGGAVVRAAFERGARGELDPTTTGEVEALWTYPVPAERLDGTCGSGEDLAAMPHNLGSALGVEAAAAGDWEAVKGHRESRRLATLREVCERLAESTGGTDWVGVYRVVPHGRAGQTALMKEAYRGEPSRAFFPLTASFAKGSNNSTVAMERVVTVIHDTAAGDDGPYYVCDGKVRSEFCAPIVAGSGEVIGIIDAEAWRPNHFTKERTRTFLQACVELGRLGLGLAE